jgi:hypothetical protein
MEGQIRSGGTIAKTVLSTHLMVPIIIFVLKIMRILAPAVCIVPGAQQDLPYFVDGLVISVFHGHLLDILQGIPDSSLVFLIRVIAIGGMPEKFRLDIRGRPSEIGGGREKLKEEKCKRNQQEQDTFPAVQVGSPRRPSSIQ